MKLTINFIKIKKSMHFFILKLEWISNWLGCQRDIALGLSTTNHILRYQIEVDSSSGLFKSAKLKDKEYTRYVLSFYT